MENSITKRWVIISLRQQLDEQALIPQMDVEKGWEHMSDIHPGLMIRRPGVV